MRSSADFVLESRSKLVHVTKADLLVELAARKRPAVIVVGAGVSGCACAAVLAEKGIRTTVLNSALDRVNLPEYGPYLTAGAGGWSEIEETMDALPSTLCQAWLQAAAVPEDGSPMLIIDRRAVSIEAKRALEGIQGLEFRQGLVGDVRTISAQALERNHHHENRIAVETVFGEVLEADAVVLAVGLAFGGHMTTRAGLTTGGRQGEASADGLRAALVDMGAQLRETKLEVGARLPGLGAGVPNMTRWDASGSKAIRTIAVRTLLGNCEQSNEGNEESTLEIARSVLDRVLDVDLAGKSGGIRKWNNSGNLWPEDYPPAPHFLDQLRLDLAVINRTSEGTTVMAACPDGLATAELYVSSEGPGMARATSANSDEGCGLFETDETPDSRLGYTVQAEVVSSLDLGGRLMLEVMTERPAIWVSGRAAGAGDYLSSLRSGVRVAEDVAKLFAERLP